MEDVLSDASINDRLSEIFRREQGRLRSFVRRRVADEPTRVKPVKEAKA